MSAKWGTLVSRDLLADEPARRLVVESCRRKAADEGRIPRNLQHVKFVHLRAIDPWDTDRWGITIRPVGAWKVGAP